MLKITGNTGNTGNTLVDAIAINWQLATKLANEPETGNKRLLQVLAAQRCNLLPVTNVFYAHTFLRTIRCFEVSRCGLIFEVAAGFSPIYDAQPCGHSS